MYQEAADVCIYIKSSLCKWGLGKRGERCSIDKKSKGVGLQHTKYIIANGKLR